MGLRTDFHAILEDVLGSDNVYFQPPASITMEYPCITYQLGYIDTQYADNNPYHLEKRYTVILIDRDPDSVVIEKLANLPKSIFDRHYTADNLNHDVFSIYY